MEEKELNYFRVKTECIVELPNGALGKKKIEELSDTDIIDRFISTIC